MGKVFSSGARAELAATINSTDTTLTIVEGGELFPEATVDTGAVTAGGDWFKLTLQDKDGIEIVYCRTHSSGSNEFSNLLRGQEGTTAREFLASAVVGLRPTHGDAEDWEAKENAIPLGESNQFLAGDKTWKGIQQSHVAGLATSLGTKVDKVPGKQLSTEDYTTSDRNKLITIQEGAQVNPIPVTNLASTDDTLPLAASQGKVLKDLIDYINTLLQSDDSTLDELQEIVDFIKLNRADLEALGISSIAGLQSALDGKQPISSVLTGTTASFTTALKNKLDAIAAQATKNESDAYLLNRTNHTGTQPASSITGLHDVATSGSYNDLLNKPSIPPGTVTSVGISAPTGLSVSNSPVTSSGTIAISYAAGYAIPTTAKQSQWDTAYGWGNHASAGYAKTASPTFTGTVTLPATVMGDAALTRAMLKDCGFTYYNSGTTSTLNYVNGSHQRWAPTGSATLAVTNWPPSGNLGELLIEGVNLGAATITWPAAVNWVKSDGTTSTTFADTGVTLQTSGVDFVLLWTRDAGTTIYGKVMR